MDPKYCWRLNKYIPFGEFYCHECDVCEALYCAVPDEVITSVSDLWNPELSVEENVGNLKFYKSNALKCRLGYDTSGCIPSLRHDPVSYWSGNPRSFCIQNPPESDEKKERRKSKAKAARDKKKKEENERKHEKFMRKQKTIDFNKKKSSM